MAQKELSEKECQAILSTLSQIEEEGGHHKNERLEKEYAKFEQDLEYIGCSAIEDKLQENVAETIDMFLNTNIRVWVLTGDKLETAIEIAKSCKLIQKDFKQILLHTNVQHH